MGLNPDISQAEFSAHREEYDRCVLSNIYFTESYCKIYDATLKDWIPFDLWDAQRDVLQTVYEHRLVVILKARQLGLTWLMLGHALWLMIFHPQATILLFSRREEEAKHLLQRITGMYARLPQWMRDLAPTVSKNTTVWQLGNGSEARAFPTTAGDSYTASFALADEFDIVEDQGHLITAVKPTIDGGGSMVLLSRVDKARPMTDFKRIYEGGKRKENSWIPIFLPWYVRPERTLQWYEEQKSDVMARTGSLDDLYEQYPATDIEALSARSLDKRIPPQWIINCYDERESLPCVLPIASLKQYAYVDGFRQYVIGADPAEGNPSSDDSSLTVIDAYTGEEVAALYGKFEPNVFGYYIAELARYYNHAQVLVERNNHGHAVLLWLTEQAADIMLLNGRDDRAGWLTVSLSKTIMYDIAAEDFRLGLTTMHTRDTYGQLSSIEGSTQKAPEGMHDDLALSYALALVARTRAQSAPMPSGEEGFQDDKTYRFAIE